MRVSRSSNPVAWMKTFVTGLILVLATLFFTFRVSAKQQAPPPEGIALKPFPIVIGGTGTGTITVTPVSGGFIGTYKDPTPPGNLTQLEKNLGQDHLNWLSVCSGTTRTDLPPGVSCPFIDPPNGGYGGSNIADPFPWYWDEPSSFGQGKPGYDPGNLLKNNTGVNKIDISDAPGGAVGSTSTFDIFLISIFNDGTYQPLGGFTVTVTVGSDHKSHVGSVTPYTGTFPTPYEGLIGKFPPPTKNGPPWKIHPAPKQAVP